MSDHYVMICLALTLATGIKINKDQRQVRYNSFNFALVN